VNKTLYFLKRINHKRRISYKALRVLILYCFYYCRHYIFPKRYHFHNVSPNSSRYRDDNGFYSSQLVIDIKPIGFEYNLVEMVAVPFGTRLREDYANTFAVFAIKENISQCNNRMFWLAGQESIDQSISDGDVHERCIYEQAIVVPGYLTNHFGHFCAEVLGTIFYIADQIRNGSLSISIGITAPSKGWMDLIKQIFPTLHFFEIVDPRILKKRVAFSNAHVVIPLSPWQGILYARNRIMGFLPDEASRDDINIYLRCNSKRTVANSIEIDAYLESRGFKLIDPLDMLPLQLLDLVKNAALVISEQGSIVLNVLLCRAKDYIVLTPNNYSTLSLSDYAGGYMFNQIGSGSMIELRCAVAGEVKNRKHYFSQLIKVDLQELGFLIETLGRVTKFWQEG
jgi:hypothetical protein